MKVFAQNEILSLTLSFDENSLKPLKEVHVMKTQVDTSIVVVAIKAVAAYNY